MSSLSASGYQPVVSMPPISFANNHYVHRIQSIPAWPQIINGLAEAREGVQLQPLSISPSLNLPSLPPDVQSAVPCSTQSLSQPEELQFPFEEHQASSIATQDINEKSDNYLVRLIQEEFNTIANNPRTPVSDDLLALLPPLELPPPPPIAQSFSLNQSGTRISCISPRTV